MSFDISKFAEGFGVSDPDTSGPDRIEYIDLDLIDGDPGNGYSLADIEQLADNIQTVGLLQPLRLRPGTQGRYFVSSGHRRRLALRRLVQDGDERFRRVPCIVDRDGASPALQELRLLYGNANNRAKTSADLAQEARRVEALLVRLKGEGFQFRGRTRAMVARLLQVSETRVANAQAIERGLKNTQLRVWWQSGKMSEAAALAAARMEPKDQDALGVWLLSERAQPSLANVREFYGILPKIDHVCKLAGQPCPNARAMYQHFCRGGNWEGCCGCCAMCLKRDTCETCCQYVERKAPAPEPAPPISEPKPGTDWQRAREAFAARLRAAREATGLDRAAFAERIGAYKATYSAWENGSLPGSSQFPDLARALGVTTDYLYGLTDDPHGSSVPPELEIGFLAREEIAQSITPEDAAEAERHVFRVLPPEPPEQQLVLAGWMPGGVDPSEPGLFAAVLDLDGKPVKRLLRWQGGKWLFEHVTTEINVPVLWWLRLPPVPGEEETC